MPEDSGAAARDALTDLDAAFERGDLPAILDLCTSDVVFIGSGEGEEAIGRENLEVMFAAIAERSEGVEFSVEWDSVDAEVVGDVAVLTAWGTATLRSPRGDRRGRYRLTGVLLRRGGRWLWRVHHGSEPVTW